MANRRTFLYGLGSLPVTIGVASIAAPSAFAGTISSPAAALMAEFKQLAHEECTTSAKFDATYEALKYPDAPEEVFCREGDMATLRWHGWDVDYRTKRRWWGEDERIERLRADDFGKYISKINRKAAARRDEIVTSWDRWQAERKAAEDRCGFTAARAVWTSASDRYDAFRLRLIHMQTTDRDVMAVKAAVVTERYCHGKLIYLDRAIERQLEQQDDLEALCFSIVRDFAMRSGAEVSSTAGNLVTEGGAS